MATFTSLLEASPSAIVSNLNKLVGADPNDPVWLVIYGVFAALI